MKQPDPTIPALRSLLDEARDADSQLRSCIEALGRLRDGLLMSADVLCEEYMQRVRADLSDPGWHQELRDLTALSEAIRAEFATVTVEQTSRGKELKVWTKAAEILDAHARVRP